jgi:hypothetical protein
MHTDVGRSQAMLSVHDPAESRVEIDAYYATCICAKRTQFLERPLLTAIRNANALRILCLQGCYTRVVRFGWARIITPLYTACACSGWKDGTTQADLFTTSLRFWSVDND